MKIVIDIEANGLHNPTHIWVIVCRDYDTKELHIFRKVTEDDTERERFRSFAENVDCWIGHNILAYDMPVLANLLGISFEYAKCHDTFILSKLIDYSRASHSIEGYGEEFGLPKLEFTDWSSYSLEMEEYCVRDVDISEKIYDKYARYINNPKHDKAIKLEHSFQEIVTALRYNGFHFNKEKATELLTEVEDNLKGLDDEISKAFPPRLRLLREVHPTYTKHGTLHRKDFRHVLDGDLSEYNGGPFSRCRWEEFNPSSHKQIIEVLHSAGWKPTNKTKTHIQIERELNLQRYKKTLDNEQKVWYNTRLEYLSKYGWKIDNDNLETLPENAPAPARTLAQRILLEARRRTLVEWLSLVWHEIEINKTELIGIGINEKLMPIQSGLKRNVLSEKNGEVTTSSIQENVTDATISKDHMDFLLKTFLEYLKNKKVSVSSVKEKQNSVLITVIGQEQLEGFSAALVTAVSDGLKSTPIKYTLISSRIHGDFQGIGAWSHRMSHQNPNTANIPTGVKLYGDIMRSIWNVPEDRLLIGVDAEGIQLRIFAHYINDQEFTDALVKGKKEEKTDPHSLNQRVLGDVCSSRQIAKRFIYALLLGAGLGKLAEILSCSQEQAREALRRILERYAGFAYLKETTIPRDAKRGWFDGLDGRSVRIPGESTGDRRHLCMSGYLQNGEAIVMKLACLHWHRELTKLKIPFKIVNFVHDEWQTETVNDMDTALEIARIQSDSLRIVGEELNLNCPLAGSYWNDDHHCYTIGKDWSTTH